MPIKIAGSDCHRRRSSDPFCTQAQAALRGCSGLSWSELASRLNERFGVTVRSNIFCFLHLLRKGTSVPMTITSTATAIKSPKAPCLAGATGGVAAVVCVLAVSEGVLAAAAGVVAAAGALAVSEDELAVTSGAVVATAAVSDRLR